MDVHSDTSEGLHKIRIRGETTFRQTGPYQIFPHVNFKGPGVFQGPTEQITCEPDEYAGSDSVVGNDTRQVLIGEESGESDESELSIKNKHSHSLLLRTDRVVSTTDLQTSP